MQVPWGYPDHAVSGICRYPAGILTMLCQGYAGTPQVSCSCCVGDMQVHCGYPDHAVSGICRYPEGILTTLYRGYAGTLRASWPYVRRMQVPCRYLDHTVSGICSNWLTEALPQRFSGCVIRPDFLLAPAYHRAGNSMVRLSSTVGSPQRSGLLNGRVSSTVGSPQR